MKLSVRVRLLLIALLLGAGLAFGQGSCGLVAVKRDAVRQMRWAVTVDCEHPERPARLAPWAGEDVDGVATRVGAAATVVVEAPLVVQAGERVRVWMNDGVVRMETMGVAQEGGAMGKRIRVRILRQGMESVAEERFVTGVVAGPSSVEMER